LAGACAAKGMSQGNGSSFGVEFGVVNTEVFDAVGCLAGKSLVDLPDVDI
jgi:hypothetical protein